MDLPKPGIVSALFRHVLTKLDGLTTLAPGAGEGLWAPPTLMKYVGCNLCCN